MPGKVVTTGFSDSGNEYTATLLTITRPADDVVKRTNQFNSPAPEGQEFVIFRVRVGYDKSGKPDQLTTRLSHCDFDLLVQSGEILKGCSQPFAVIPDEFRKELVPGGVAEGNLLFAVNKGMAMNALVFKFSDFGRQGAWFGIR